MTGRDLDSQQIELVGTAWLSTLLLADGIEIAEPIRDRGVDLVAFIDAGYFRAVPLQVKAHTEARFSVHRKYARFPELRIVHLWNVLDPTRARAFCTTYAESVALATEFGWTKTASWNRAGYSTAINPSSKGGERISDALSRFEVTPGSWHGHLFGLERVVARPDENLGGADKAFVLFDGPVRYQFNQDGHDFHSGESGRVLIDLTDRTLWVRQDTMDGEPVTLDLDAGDRFIFRPHGYVALDVRPERVTATRETTGELLVIEPL